MKAIVYVGMAAVAGGLALVMALRGEGSGSSHASGGAAARLLPELSERVNDVAGLRVEHAGDSFTISRGEERWGMDDKGGYPVDMGKVRELLIALAGAEVIEEKTSNPELYERLGVQEPDDSEESSTRLVLLDEGGSELASLIVGERRASSGGMSSPGASASDAYYVRKSGASPSWLVSGKLAVDGDPSRWLDREILSIERERIAAARVEHADGEVLAVRKAAREDTNFALSDVPEGRELRYEGVANSFGSSLSNLTLDDVRPAAELELASPPTAKTSFWTFDKLRVDVTLEEREEKLYARFAAAYDELTPSAPGALGPPIQVEPEEAAAGDEGEGDGEDGSAEGDETDQAEEEEPQGLTPEEVRAEVAALNAKLEPWVYVLPSWKKSSFIKRMSDMLKEPPSAAEDDQTPEDDVPTLPSEGLEDDTAGAEDPDTPTADDDSQDAVPPEEGEGPPLEEDVPPPQPPDEDEVEDDRGEAPAEDGGA